MARRATRTVTAEPVTVDSIESLLSLLNTISGIDFVEDAWVEKAPANYGVVELNGQNAAEYADGKLIEQGFGLTITIYVTGGSHQWIGAVQEKLDSAGVGYSMPKREYLQDIHKVSWAWNVMLYGPIITVTEAAE